MKRIKQWFLRLFQKPKKEEGPTQWEYQRWVHFGSTGEYQVLYASGYGSTWIKEAKGRRTIPVK